jgi:hypothetical protein
MVIAKKNLVTLSGILFLLVFLGAVLLRQYYTRYMPESIQVEQGRIVPIDVNYNKTVYVKPSEKKELETAYVAVGVMGVAFVFFALKFARDKT